MSNFFDKATALYTANLGLDIIFFVYFCLCNATKEKGKEVSEFSGLSYPVT